MAVIMCVHLSSLTSSTIQSQRKKSSHGTAASVFPDVKVLLVSQATHSEYAFTSFYLDAVWWCCCTSDIGHLLRDSSAEQRLYKHEGTRICRATAAQWTHQINMLLCSEGQTDQVKESDRVKGQCSSASIPDLSDRGGFLWSSLHSLANTGKSNDYLLVKKARRYFICLLINCCFLSQCISCRDEVNNADSQLCSTVTCFTERNVPYVDYIIREFLFSIWIGSF